MSAEKGHAEARRYIGLAVKSERRARGLTQDALGRRAGCSGATICNIENGESVPGFMLMTAIAEALDIDIQKLSDGVRTVIRLIQTSQMIRRLEEVDEKLTPEYVRSKYEELMNEPQQPQSQPDPPESER